MRLTATTGEFKHTTTAEMNHDERDRLPSRLASLGRDSEITGTTTDRPADGDDE